MNVPVCVAAMRLTRGTMARPSLCMLPLLAMLVVTLGGHSTSSAPIARTIKVSKDGTGDATTIQAAINVVPDNNGQWIQIQVSPGIYWEKVTIPPSKTYVYLQGSSRDTTVIAYDDHESTNTSPTFSLLANNFVAKDITFKNAYLTMEGYKGSPLVPAVAIDIHGDKAAFYSCGFIGLQDTIFDAVGLHYFYNCYIEGMVDFIWGCGQSFYQECTINVLLGTYVGPGYAYGYITAQGLQAADDPSGFVFSHCRVVGDTFKAYLGRAYREYARVLFIESNFADVIVPQGWDAWRATGKESNLVNVEADCTGPGADLSRRAEWVLSSSYPDLNKYSTVAYVNQWNWLGEIPV
ncbi:hypothetical protein MLD38_012374 [Melastoma candidum]|uniref:Uncharacterized protein n=1 Tax=Melastoma candidum TaxID=119954 RepID=A0ACB9R638_9MYRT|nr:hypothetical protein MLD38_012374 [Melastoma candidum]